MQNNKENKIVELTFQFSIEVIKYVELLEEKRKYVLANQLLKSGTSIGANVREAQNGESKNDFIQKKKIAHKETDETLYWLELCKASENYPTNESRIEKILFIQKILSKIIGTTRTNLKNQIIEKKLTHSNYQIVELTN